MFAGQAISCQRLAVPGMVRIDVGHGFEPWTRRRARKAGECVLTGRRFAVGDTVYGPLGNQLYRGARILASSIDPKE